MRASQTHPTREPSSLDAFVAMERALELSSEQQLIDDRRGLDLRLLTNMYP